MCLSNDSESIVLFLQQKEALFVSIGTKCSTRAFRTLSICTQWESFRSQPASILALSRSETSLISLNLRLRIISVIIKIIIKFLTPKGNWYYQTTIVKKKTIEYC